MAKKKTGCVTMGCASFFIGCAAIFVLVMVVGSINGPVETTPLNDQRTQVQKEPAGTVKRLEQEVAAVIEPDYIYSVDVENREIHIQLQTKEAPLFQLSEAKFQYQFAAILKAVADSGYKEYGTIQIEAISQLVDKFGNESLSTVATTSFPKENIDQVNWSNFLPLNLKGIALDYAFHPAVDRR